MFSSMFKVTVTKLCKRRTFATSTKLEGTTTDTTREELNWFPKELTHGSGNGRIWENEEHVRLKHYVYTFVRNRIYVAGHMLPHGEKVEDVVRELRETIKGVLVPPATSSPLLKHYTSFIEKLDSFTDLDNVPDQCKRLYLRNGLKHLYFHPVLCCLKAFTFASFYIRNDSRWMCEIEVTGSTDTSPGLITTSSTPLSKYYNLCSAKNDPERYHYLGSDLSGIKNEAIRNSFRFIENPPKDFRFVEPFELLKVYHNHTPFYWEGELGSTPVVFVPDKELYADLGLVLLDCWDYTVATGKPDSLLLD